MNKEKNAPVQGDNKKKGFFAKIAAVLPTVAVVARYCVPLINAIVLFVMGFFYNVGAASGAQPYMQISIWRLLWNTLVGAREYLGGEAEQAKDWFYGSLSALSIATALFFLPALFFAGLAAYTSIRAFLAGHESEQSNRMKLAFKMAFPNRVCLFLSNLLILIPAAYPHFYSLISSNFLLIGGQNVVYILNNPLLLVTGILCGLSLVLALIIPRYERRRKMNMFLLWHEQE